MKNISQSKISYYCRNRRSFLNNPRYKSRGRVKTKPTFNQRIKEAQNRFIEQCGPVTKEKIEEKAQANWKKSKKTGSFIV